MRTICNLSLKQLPGAAGQSGPGRRTARRHRRTEDDRDTATPCRERNNIIIINTIQGAHNNETGRIFKSYILKT